MGHGKLQIQPIQLRMSMAYLIKNGGYLILVDAGMRGEESRIMQAISSFKGCDLQLIYITHAHLDHYGSAAAVRRLTGASIAIHKADAAAMAAGETRLGEARGKGRIAAALLPLAGPLLRAEPAKADILLEDDERLDGQGLAAMSLHTPGHTPGSTCLVFGGERIAFSGDLVTTSGGPHVQRTFAEDWQQIYASLRRLQAADPEWVYPGHGRQLVSREALQRLGRS
jgi:hydroxyacylglutathione hydrolase